MTIPTLNEYAAMLQPMDEYNQSLLAHVHPLDWVDPTPAQCYDLLVIGAGTAGLVIAAGAAGLGLGLKVALIEKNLMGGDCLNVGCVPSKSIIRSARVIADIKNSAPFGIHVPQDLDIDFAAVMERMRRIRAGISHHDSAARFKNLGVDVFLGAAKFVSQSAVEVNGLQLRFKKAAIATGARASRLKVTGLEEAGYLTNETVFSLTERPKRLAVIGGGPIGCELAQAFQRLGCAVSLIHKNSYLLNHEDADAAEVVQRSLINDGIDLILEANLESVTVNEQGKVIHYRQNGEQKQIAVDEILVGAGRSPNVEGLNLEAAGVQYTQKGVTVNDYLQTSNANIYAAGDICMDWKFTHAADAAARIVIKNALFAPFGLGKSKLSNLVMPWVTFSDPEIAHVGMYASEAHAQGLATGEIKIPFTSVDRAIFDGETAGFVKILYQKGSDRILGGTIVARHAGEMIGEISLAIVAKQGLNTLSSVIHSYPTQADAIKKAADAYRKTLLTPRTQTFLKILSKFTSLTDSFSRPN